MAIIADWLQETLVNSDLEVSSVLVKARPSAGLLSCLYMKKNNAIDKAKQLYLKNEFLPAVKLLLPYEAYGQEEVLRYLAMAYQKVGQIDRCLQVIEKFESKNNLEANPAWVSIKFVALCQSKQMAAAELLLLSGVKKYPSILELQYNTSVMYANKGDWKPALEHALLAKKIAPDSIEVLIHIGRVAVGLRDTNLANEVFEKVIKLSPTIPDGYNGLGAAKLLEHKASEAVQYFIKALDKDARHATTLGNLGVAYKAIGRYDDSRLTFAKAITIEPANTEHQWNLALLELLLGDYESGWKRYEWRYHPDRTVLDRIQLPNITTPMLKPGDNIQGKVVGLMAEQGFGDNIQFSRYAQGLREEGAMVVILASEPLMPLMQSLPWANFVCNRWSVCPVLDYWVYPMSLPARYQTKVETIPNKLPYLFAQEGDIQHWAGILGKKHKKLRVGLVWAGRPGHGNDKNRSMALKDFEVLDDKEIEFISLQTGSQAQESADSSMDIQFIGSKLKTFADSAAVLAQLDLLISIDSAPVHLAGALGCPVWVLLPYNPDFRWMLGRDDSPWYGNNMKLFRQTEPGNWLTVLLDVSRQLALLKTQHISRSTLAIPSIPIDPEKLNEAGAMPLLRVAMEKQIQGQGAIAAKIYEFILQFNPKEIDAWRNWGVYLRSIGELEKARICYQKCLEINPKDSTTHLNYANLLADMREMDLAKQHAILALELDKTLHNAWYILSSAHFGKNEFVEAENAINQALVLNLNNVIYLTMKAIVLMRTDRTQESRAYFDRAQTINPLHPELLIGFAQLLMHEHRYEESLEAHTRLLTTPDLIPIKLQPEVLTSRATLQTNLGRFEEAVKDTELSIEYDTNNADARFNLGVYKLMTGNFDTGWQDYESRYSPNRKAPDRVVVPSFYDPQKNGTLWDGGNLVGKSILILPEQGFGDNLQFVRYAKLLKEKGATVYMACHIALRELMQTCVWLDGVYSDLSKIPNTDYSVLPLSLPYCFKTAMETIPCEVPYLHTPISYREKWREKLSQKGLLNKPLVVIVYKGSTLHGNDENRSIAIERFSKVFSAMFPFDAVFLDQSSRGEAYLDCAGQKIINLGAEVENFSDTAAIFDYSDLVVSVDSAPLHLAGALGRPTIGLLAFVPDWRWMVDRSDTPWYPSLYLLRQKEPNDWSNVFERLNSMLLNPAQWLSQSKDLLS